MQAIGNSTYLFMEVFPDYETFEEWYKSTSLSDGEDDVPSKKTFSLIYNEYAESHIAFSKVGFSNHFANDLYTYYKEFEATTKAIDDLMKLSDDEIANDTAMILNIANIPETEGSTDDETVNFVSQQQKNITKKGKLQIKKEQLSSKRTYTTKTFLNRFRHLFKRVCRPTFITYYVEEDEDY